MLVRDWMTREVVSLTPDSNAYTALEIMAGSRIRHVLIRDEDGELLGMVSNRDLVRISMQHPEHILELTRTPVSQIMTPSPLLCVGPDQSMAEAAQLLYERKISAVPVLDDGEVVGILTTSDFLRTFWQEPRPGV